MVSLFLRPLFIIAHCCSNSKDSTGVYTFICLFSQTHASAIVLIGSRNCLVSQSDLQRRLIINNIINAKGVLSGKIGQFL